MKEDFTVDNRIAAIAAMIPKCRCVADIGTDHGFLGVHLLMQNRCDRAVFTDISETSLRKAYKLVKRLELLDRADFLVGDGLEPLAETPDVAVIAGMGGITMAGIVERGRHKLGGAGIVMQPNVGIPELRSRLAEMGYAIVDEDIVRAGNRWYIILAAKPGRVAYTDQEIMIGPALLKKRHENLPGYAQFRLRVTKKALSEASRSERPVAEQFEKEIAMWEEVVKQ